MLFKIVVGIGIIFSLSATAAPLNYNRALEIAKKQNPELRQAEEIYQATAWKPMEAIGANLPRLQVTGQHLIDVVYPFIDLASGARFDVIQPKTNAVIGAYWTVFDGLQGINSHRSAIRLKDAASLEREQASFSMESKLRTSFYGTLAARALVHVYEENVKALKEHLDKTQETLKRGSSTKFDVLRIQVQLEEVEAALQESQDKWAISLRELANILGEEGDFQPVGELPEPKSMSEKESRVFEESAELSAEAARLREEAADIDSTAHIGAYLPKLTLFGERQYYNNTSYALSAPLNTAHSVGVSLSWNIFDLGLIARERQIAHTANATQALSRANVLKAHMERETWFRKLRYSQYLFRAKERAVELAKEELRLARLGYNAGTRTSTDVLDAQVDLFRAQAGRLRAQIDNIEAQGRLESIFGRSI